MFFQILRCSKKLFDLEIVLDVCLPTYFMITCLNLEHFRETFSILRCPNQSFERNDFPAINVACEGLS